MAKFKLNNLLNFYNLNQKDLSDGTGINKNTINRYCNNTFDKITKEHLDLIVSFFQCSLEDIIEVKSDIEIHYPSPMIKNMIESYKVMEKLSPENISNIVTTDESEIESYLEYQEQVQKENEEHQQFYLENKQEIDEWSYTNQIRFLTELKIDELVSIFLNKIVENFTSSFIINKNIQQLFKRYKKHDLLETESKVKTYYRILYLVLEVVRSLDLYLH
jgi:putative transcriptional regulator